MNNMNLKQILPDANDAHWEPMINNIMSRTFYSRPSQASVFSQIFNWAVPAVAAAALITAAVWGIALFQPHSQQNTMVLATHASTPAEQLLSLATQTDTPSTNELYTLLGGSDATR